MSKANEDLTRFALMLEADPEILASKPLDQVRAELIARGINPDTVQQSVATMVGRWLDSVSSPAGGQTPSPLIQQASMPVTNERGGSVAVEPWTPDLVSLASKLPLRHYASQFRARFDALESLDVEPYLRIGLGRGRLGHTVTFALEPRADLKSPGRMLTPKKGQVAIRLLRPRKRRTIVAVLGPKLLKAISLPTYTLGEESEWRIEISVRLDVQA